MISMYFYKWSLLARSSILASLGESGIKEMILPSYVILQLSVIYTDIFYSSFSAICLLYLVSTVPWMAPVSSSV